MKRQKTNHERPAPGAPDNQFDIPKPLIDRLDRLARISGRSRQSLVDECVERGLLRIEPARYHGNGGAR